MSLTQEEKNYIIDKVVSTLKSPDKKELIDKLREKVLGKDTKDTKNEKGGPEEEDLDDAVYAVLQAIEELYG